MTVEEDFEIFMGYLSSACSNMTDNHYFQLPVVDKEDPIFRERVYCYELYHQLQNVIPNGFNYKLHGEVDKKGHPIFRSRIPDFIVHDPGSMNNLIVIEIKSIEGIKDARGFRSDIDTFIEFLGSRNGYFKAIYLIYGNGSIDFPSEILTIFENEMGDFCENSVIVWHPGPGEEIDRLWEL